MKLCLDCGNTRIKWGLHNGNDWLAQGAVATAKSEQLGSALAPYPVAEQVIACNVAGAALADAIAAQFPQVVWNLACAEQAGVTNHYESPQRLGADRWAALLGARAIHDGPCVVVNAGTATTIDLLDGNGHFLGGLILPGLDLMARALASNTAQLPHAPGHYAAIPRNSEDAIASGAIHATLGALERMAHHLELASGTPPLCLLAGGAASRLEAHISLPLRPEPLLILNGLARLGP